MDAKLLAQLTGATYANAQTYADPLNIAMVQFGISGDKQVAAFLATVSIESARLTQVEEGLFYRDANRLAAIFPRAFRNAAEAQPYVGNPKALGQKLYDGYSGRGLIQLTFRKNYERASKALGYDYVGNPELVLQAKHAALTAAWFWADAGCAGPGAKGDMVEVTRLVNGPAKLHLVERTAQYQINIGVLSA